MALSVETVGDARVLHLQGRLDSNTAAGTEAEILAQLAEGHHRLVLDFAGLDYISSAGLRVVLVVAKKLKQAGGALVLCGLKPHIREIFEISGFLSILTVTSDQAAALAAL